jgi:6-phospho-beta-glucosidase
LARKLDLVCDETLGPSALRRILRSAQELRTLGRRIAREAPNAFVLNLTNPLSLSTALLAEVGVENCIGICELPQTTARAAATALGAAVDSPLEFTSIGLNHRGFIVSLKVNGADLLPNVIEDDDRLRASGAEAPFLGFSRALIRELRAIPTKYFSLIESPKMRPPPRAARVADIGRLVLSDLESDRTSYPQSLSLRVTDWYEEAVVPLLEALGDESPRKLCVNVTDGSDLVREGVADVNNTGAHLCKAPTASAAVEGWVSRYETHERALIALLQDPNRTTLASALDLDPLVPAERRADTLQALVPELDFAQRARDLPL